MKKLTFRKMIDDVKVEYHAFARYTRKDGVLVPFYQYTCDKLTIEQVKALQKFDNVQIGFKTCVQVPEYKKVAIRVFDKCINKAVQNG